MNKVRLTINAIATVLFTLLLATAAQAQATRTWVSGVGDDANPCSRTAPCKTFAGAISKTATGGEIDVLDPGGFGTLTITKSITVDGGQGSGWASILNSGTNGIIINVTAVTNAVVTIRNISINGAGTTLGLNGIRIIASGTSGGKVYVENCQIFGQSGRGITDERNAGANQLHVTDTIVRNNNGDGIAAKATSGASTVTGSFSNVRSEGNGGSGFQAGPGSNLVISNSMAAGNPGAGFFVDGTGAGSSMNLESCVASNNGQGVSVITGGTARVSSTHITLNNTGLSAGGGLFLTYSNNKVFGNGAGNDFPPAPATSAVGPK